MMRYAARRLGALVFLAIGVSVIDFAIIRLVPGDPARNILGTSDATPALIARLNSQLGLDRPVVNRTGLKGRFDIHLEFAPDEAIDVRQAPGAAGGLSGPSIFTAVQEQLGLKLEPARGPREYLVIDRVERPLDN